MNIHFKIVLTASILMSTTIFLDGCASQKKVTGHWRAHEITANGIDDEWQNDTPQYYNEEQHLTIRILNDDKKISLTVSTSAPELQQQIHMSGLTVWFDPQGGKKKILGLHVPAAEGRSGPPGRGGPGPPDRHRDMPNTENHPLPHPNKVEPIKSLSITYSDTTGPLEMMMEEVRRTGIDIGVGQTRDGRLIYEFDIKFSAAPSLEELKSGMVVGIGITGTTFGQSSNIGRPPGIQATRTQFGDNIGHPAGDRKGPGNNKPPRRGKGKTFEIWLKVKLA